APGHAEKATLGDRLAGDIEPDSFEANQRAIAGIKGLALFPDISDSAGLGVANTKGAGNAGWVRRPGAKASRQSIGVRFMDHIPKASGGTATIGGWQAGPLLDP